MNRYDLLVAGGGPAGTAAAITAGGFGGRVLLLERGRYPRQKVCGEFVSSEAVDMLWKLLPASEQGTLACAERTTEARFYIDASIIRFSLPPAAGIPRTQLDCALWNTAETINEIDCRQNVSVENVVYRGGAFEVTTTAGTFVVRAVIDASGRWSKLRRNTAAENKGENWIGLKGHFRNQASLAADDRTTDMYFFPGGYCGVQPVGSGLLNVCAMVTAESGRDIRDVFRMHPALQARSASWVLEAQPYAVAPLSFRDPEPTSGNVLRTGDAAAFIDPFVGDGISLALRSGALAGEIVSGIWRRNLSVEAAAQLYADHYRTRFMRPLRTARILRTLLSGPAAARRLSILLMKVPGVAQYLVRHTR